MSEELAKAENKISVIVVGAGPAGVAAAITVARAGHKVLLVERGDFSGAKNMYGGAMYSQPLKEIFPDFEESAPIERYTVEHRYALLTDDEGTIISHKSENEIKNSFTAIRSKFDKWAVEQAIKEGVYYAPKTVVRSLLTDKEKIVGIKTDLENYYSDIVILADGVNSLLAKQLGLRKNFKPNQMALGIKEVINLDKEILENRFNVKENQGVIYELMGGPMKGMLGLGYIYTNQKSVTIGLGVALDELKEKKKKPYEMLNELKAHPVIAPLIKDGELAEYSAHLIPEGGFNAIPTLYDDGVMIVGDAAMLVDNIHWEGTNLALISGKFAGETAVEAINNNDFSKDMLELYQKKLEASFIYKDMKSYKNLMPTMHSRAKSFLEYYPEKASEFFKAFTGVKSVPKKEVFRRYIYLFLRSRSLLELIKDGVAIIKLVFEALK